MSSSVAFFGKRRARCGVAVLLAQQVEHVGRVAGVEHAEAGRQPERGRVPAHEPVRDRVERPAEHARRRRAPAPRARWSISRAARRVNVSSRMRSDGTPSATSQATRAHSVVVLPVPAPARISSGPPACVAAARCSSLSSSSQGRSSVGATHRHRPPDATQRAGRLAAARREPLTRG